MFGNKRMHNPIGIQCNGKGVPVSEILQNTEMRRSGKEIKFVTNKKTKKRNETSLCVLSWNFRFFFVAGERVTKHFVAEKS